MRLTLRLISPPAGVASIIRLKLAVVTGLSIFLAACSALPTSSDTALATSPLGPPVEVFHLRGRALLRQEQRIDHFRFDWQHSEERDALLIASPFGQGIGKVSRDATGASLRLADGRSERADSLEALAERLFGTAIPLSELANWLRGAYPQTAGSAGGWSIDIEQVDTLGQPESGATRVLPRVQVLRKEDLLLRLIVDERESPP